MTTSRAELLCEFAKTDDHAALSILLYERQRPSLAVERQAEIMLLYRANAFACVAVYCGGGLTWPEFPRELWVPNYFVYKNIPIYWPQTLAIIHWIRHLILNGSDPVQTRKFQEFMHKNYVQIDTSLFVWFDSDEFTDAQIERWFDMLRTFDHGPRCGCLRITKDLEAMYVFRAPTRLANYLIKNDMLSDENFLKVIDGRTSALDSRPVTEKLVLLALDNDKKDLFTYCVRRGAKIDTIDRKYTKQIEYWLS